MEKKKIGLQLYSLKNELHDNPKDFIEILKDVADAGYTGVEFARGFFGKSAKEVKDACDKYGLTPISIHVFLEDMKNNYDTVLDDIRTLGIKYVVIPGLFNTYKMSEERVSGIIDDMRQCAKKFKKDGVQLAIHTCICFFELLDDGRTILERVLDDIPADLMQVQVDTVWALISGVDPIELMNRYVDRQDLLHIKDIKSPLPKDEMLDDRRIAAIKQDEIVGEGVMNTQAIVNNAKDINIKWIIVEHNDTPDFDYAEKAMRESCKNLSKML